MLVIDAAAVVGVSPWVERDAAAPARPVACWAGAACSVSVPHSPQLGQRPSHFGLEWPHSEQTNAVLGLRAMQQSLSGQGEWAREEQAEQRGTRAALLRRAYQNAKIRHHQLLEEVLRIPDRARAVVV